MAVTNYKFSTGTFTLPGGQTVGVATGITISTDGGVVEFRGGDYRLPLAIEPGDESVEITIESSKFDVNTDPSTFIDNTLFNLILGVGSNSGGLSGTISNCKIVSYEVVSEQAGFVLSTITIRQLDPSSLVFNKSTV